MSNVTDLPEHPLSRFLRRRPCLAALRPLPPAPVPPALDLDELATELWALALQTDALRYDWVVHDSTLTREEAGSRAGRIAGDLRTIATRLDTHNRISRT